LNIKIRLSWKGKRVVNLVAYKVVSDGSYGESMRGVSVTENPALVFMQCRAALLTTGSALKMIL
jgi:hypothetical protein